MNRILFTARTRRQYRQRVDQQFDFGRHSVPVPTTYRYISVKASSGLVSVAAVTATLGKCEIVIAPPINLECGTCGASKGTVGKPFSSTLKVTGGTGPYTFSVVSGLPPGLNLNPSAGEFYGTPTAGGTYTIVSKVTDSKGNTDTATCTIVIIAPPVNLECGTCGASKAYTGTPYSASPVGNGRRRTVHLFDYLSDPCHRD